MDYARHVTLTEEERRKAGIPPATGPGVPRQRVRLIKSHRCEVAYPDGTRGNCDYERMGPAWHRFDYFREGRRLASRTLTRPVGNDVPSIEAKALELAESAFRDAVEHERRDWFARASEPTSGARKADMSKYRMSAGKARSNGGKYALCVNIGGHLVPVTGTFDAFDEAAREWRERRDLVVGCCNRLDRCWEMPRYNYLIPEGHPRRE